MDSALFRPGVFILALTAAALASAGDTYVLVQGAWGGGYGYKQVEQRLRADGHEVYRPTLSGLGERVHTANPGITLDTHIEDIVNVLVWEDLRNVVLVGHSYGGMVITGVVDRVPDRVKRLVYFDAFVPTDGESLNDIVARQWTVKDGFVLPFWNPRPSPPPHVVPQPAQTFSQKLGLRRPAEVARIPATYILTVEAGAKPETDDFFKFAERARARGWKVMTMTSDHNPQEAHVPELVRLLELP